VSRTEALAEKLAATPHGNGNTPDGAPAVRQPDRALALLDSMEAEFAKCLPDILPVDMFMRVALTGLRKTPDLAVCSRPSLLGALMECARLGLAPCTEEASLVPFNNRNSGGKDCQLIVGYQGYVQLMYRSGQVEQVVAEKVYESDEWEYSLGDGGRFFHRPNITADERGQVLFTYAYASLLGGGRTRVAITTKREALSLKAKYGRKPDSSWNTNFEEMWMKTGVRRVQKFAPKSAELRRALVVDGATFDAGGKIVPDDRTIDGETADAPEPTSAPPATAAQPTSGGPANPDADYDPWADVNVTQPGGAA
jgi:recombination protein RecT